jgi:pyrimidine-specific ribonucleoside hydrolase
MARTRVIIDTDPGVDDAVAIMLALASPEIEVVGITTVAGNVPLEKTTLNARRLLALLHRHDVPVCAGAAEAMTGPNGYDGVVHGLDGLGDLPWDEPAVALDPRSAVAFLWEQLQVAPTTIVAIGPLTNLGHLLVAHPEAATRVERVVVMGGASFEGNVTPAAEFNVWADPEAAALVAEASWPVAWMGLDATHQVFLTDRDLATFRSWSSEVGHRLAGMLDPYAAFHDEWYGSRDTIMHDALAVYEVIAPDKVTKVPCVVQVETDGRYARGATFFDRRRVHAESRQSVATAVSNDEFATLLVSRLATLR